MADLTPAGDRRRRIRCLRADRIGTTVGFHHDGEVVIPSCYHQLLVDLEPLTVRTHRSSMCLDLTIDGTLVSLNTAAQLVVGSKRIPLKSGSAGSNWQTADLVGITMGEFGSGGLFGPSTTSLPSPRQGSHSIGAVNGTSSGVQDFEGDSARLKGHFLWSRTAVSIFAMPVLAFVY